MTVKAIATIKLEIKVEGSWNDNCTMSQVYSQASESAVEKLNHLFSDEPSKIRIVGRPKIEAIVTEEQQ